MSDQRPHCVIIAGPNGAGKSTTAPVLLANYVGLPTYVNADQIARGLAGFDPDAVAMEAGRVMLDWLNRMADRGDSFAFETTLSGRFAGPAAGRGRRARHPRGRDPSAL